MSPPLIGPADTVIVAVTVPDRGSMRETVPSSLFSTHTASAPTARKCGACPTAIVAATVPLRGSRRSTFPVPPTVTQIAPSPARTAVAPSGAGNVLVMALLPGSMPVTAGW